MLLVICFPLVLLGCVILIQIALGVTPFYLNVVDSKPEPVTLHGKIKGAFCLIFFAYVLQYNHFNNLIKNNYGNS